jgi:hypothetical protein
LRRSATSLARSARSRQAISRARITVACSVEAGNALANPLPVGDRFGRSDSSPSLSTCLRCRHKNPGRSETLRQRTRWTNAKSQRGIPVGAWRESSSTRGVSRREPPSDLAGRTGFASSRRTSSSRKVSVVQSRTLTDGLKKRHSWGRCFGSSLVQNHTTAFVGLEIARRL